MVDLQAIATEFEGLVGFRQSKDMSNKLIDLTSSLSGYYFNDAHPLVNHDTIRAFLFEASRLTYDNYNGATTYSVGDIVTQDSKNWVCIQATTGNAPASSPDYWRRYDAYTEFLRELYHSAVTEVVNDWLSAKNEMDLRRGVLEQDILFDGTYRNNNTDAANTKFRGLRITPQRSRFFKIKLHRVGVSLDATKTFDLKLFQSSNQSAVQTKSIAYTDAASEQWFDLGWELDGMGTYYLGYKASTSGAQSLDTRTSVVVNDEYYSNFCSKKVLEISGFSSDGDGTTLWDVSDTTHTYSTNYGLNIEYSIYCNFSDIFTKNKYHFAKAIYYKMAVRILKELLHNPNARENRHVTNIDSNRLMYEVYGADQKKTGLIVDYEKALKEVVLDFGVDSYCLPCERKRIRWR